MFVVVVVVLIVVVIVIIVKCICHVKIPEGFRFSTPTV